MRVLAQARQVGRARGVRWTLCGYPRGEKGQAWRGAQTADATPGRRGGLRALCNLTRYALQVTLGLPGYRLHPLKGDRKGEWAVWISGNWRVTFRFEGADAIDVDYCDYH